jgi:hypothetical protein
VVLQPIKNFKIHSNHQPEKCHNRGKMSLVQKETALNEGRRNAYESGQPRKSSEELTKIYSDAKRVSAGTVFGNGDGRLGSEVRDTVVARNRAADERDAAKEAKNKARVCA